MRLSSLLAVLIASPAAFSQATLDNTPNALPILTAINGSGDIYVGEDSVGGVTGIVQLDVSGSTPILSEFATSGATTHIARGVSSDGSVVAGTRIGVFDRALRWDVSSQSHVLLEPSAGLFHTDARGVSGDGAYVVGRSRPLGSFTSNVGATACRWDASGSVELLWPNADGFSGVAVDVNQDGSVVVGWESGPDGVVPVRWEEGVGVQAIPAIPGFPVMGVDVVSPDGRVVAGYALGGSNERVGWRYVFGEGVTVLPPPPGSPFIFHAIGASNDGSRIAFRASDDTAVWTEWGGMQTLEAYVVARGLGFPNLSKNDYGIAMSDDGTTFVFANAFISDGPIGTKFRVRDGSSDSLGQVLCAPAVVNSSGLGASLDAAGVDFAAANDVELRARDLPGGAPVLFLASSTIGSPMTPPGSVGTLCLNGSIGRYLGPGDFGPASAAGTRNLRLDLAATPQPTGAVSILAGESWSFQAWFRDEQGGMPTSNLTTAVELSFQ